MTIALTTWTVGEASCGAAGPPGSCVRACVRDVTTPYGLSANRRTIETEYDLVRKAREVFYGRARD